MKVHKNDALLLAFICALLLVVGAMVMDSVNTQKQAYREWCESTPGQVFEEGVRQQWSCWTADGRKVLE